MRCKNMKLYNTFNECAQIAASKVPRISFNREILKPKREEKQTHNDLYANDRTEGQRQLRLISYSKCLKKKAETK